MSIFRDTFNSNIISSLNVRQNAMVNRTPQNIQYLNSRNSWIRMSSSVNVDDDNGALAKQYVLLGGVLNNGKLRSGIGSKNEAYSALSPGGKTNRLGIRPMPGITGIEVKSKSAYGSLREIVVKFQCWDIRQLEELELLYMRPGYTVLIEWGWAPYLDIKGQLQSNPPLFYDILNKPSTDRTQLFLDLYKKSTDSGGNYDAMFGYVRNYSWEARSDGGYDCQTIIISTGEIIESLKVNYVRPDLNNINPSVGFGLLRDEFQLNLPLNNNQKGAYSKLSEHYEKNVLAGIWAETYIKAKDPNKTISSGSIYENKYVIMEFQSSSLHSTSGNDSLVGNSNYQVYITLGAAFDIINKYVIAKSKADGKPLVKLSLDTSTYSNPIQSDLLAVAHPIQVSVDPTVCLIKSPLWYNTNEDQSIVTNIQQNTNIVELTKKAADISSRLRKASSGIGTDDQAFLKAIKDIDSSGLFNLVNEKTNIQDFINDEYGDTFEDDLKLVLQMETHLKGLNMPEFQMDVNKRAVTQSKTDQTFYLFESVSITPPSNRTNTVSQIASNLPQALNAINKLKVLPLDYFYQDTYSELGIIKNIYVNVDFLYKQAINPSLESQDHKEKNEINLYSYIKNIMLGIQAAIGNLNNFEVHVDPIDNNARVIDVNYTGEKNIYDKLFQLEVHNLKSVVRSYKLQSQIFPNQSSLIAIGSQAKGGQLGIQNNTMIDFNKRLIDRIIPEKDFPIENGLNINNNKTNITQNLASIIALFAALTKNSQNDQSGGNNIDINSLYSNAKNNLRDLIVYFQSITLSPGSNRNIIPTKFSFEMDGIGGLVIGHLFKINQDIIPRGYKGLKGVGSQLAQTVTGIGHTISGNDWTTRIDALNIILSDSTVNEIPFRDIDLNEVIDKSIQGEKINVNEIVTTKRFNQDNIYIAVNFFLGEGFTDEQTAAIVGGLLQESGLRPSSINSIGAFGIAQWLGARKIKILSKTNNTDLKVQLQFIMEEFKSGERTAYNKIRTATTLEQAIVGMAAYERYGGWTSSSTYNDLLMLGETGSRIGYATDILNRIKSGEITAV